MQTTKIKFDSVSEETINRVVDFWRTNVENSAPALAREFGLSEYIINRIINERANLKIIPHD